MNRIDGSNVTWRKSRHSNGQANCVEIATLDNGTAVRDSKDPRGPVLRFTSAQWREFLGAVKAGKHDS